MLCKFYKIFLYMILPNCIHQIPSLLDKTVPPLKFFISFYYFKLCLCVVCAHDCRCSNGPEELDSAGTGVTGGYEHLAWFLGTELVTSRRAGHTLNY